MDYPIHYYSTNHNTGLVTFRQALLKGLAPDKGLYIPVEIPEIPKEEFRDYEKLPYSEIAYHVSRRFLEGEIPDTDLLSIVRDSYNYDIPLENVFERKYVMRLDQGPTASFKDFAARMMGRLMQYYLRQNNQKLLILTATSGDTGSAVANAFYGLDNIGIVVLFPKNEVTDRQRKQMTTLGKNVHVVALDAKFDDCQSLVKKAFSDPDLDYLQLSSANSINIGRLIPQTIYYFFAYVKRRISGEDESVIFSVPSGNFGDMMGGILAMKMGLPVSRFVIATNENDEFPKYLNTGVYKKVEPSRNCISSAMNVGHPSNLARLVALYGGVMDETGKLHQQADLEQMRKDLYAVSITDECTRSTIDQAYRLHGLLLEPHGSVGWAGLLEYLKSHPGKDSPGQLFISLETAHPAKFPEEIQKILSVDPPLPPSLEGIDKKTEYVSEINHDYPAFKNFLIDTF